MFNSHILRSIAYCSVFVLMSSLVWAATPVYLDDDWSVISNGADPDGGGPATVYWDGVSAQPPGADAASSWTVAYTLVDSGGTINVSAGLYPISALFSIAKPLTVLGPQANVDPRPSFGSARTVDGVDEAVFQRQPNGRMFAIDSSNVEFNGCQFAMQTAATADLIDSSIASSNQVFRYNIFHRANDELIQLRNVDGAIIEYNYFTNGGQDGINLCCGAINGLVQYNELYLTGGSNGAIFIYDDGGVNGALNHTIQYNLLRNSGGQGLDLGSATGDNDCSNVDVIGNIISGAGETGIEVQFTNVNVIGNEVRNALGNYGGIGLRGNTSSIAEYNVVHNTTVASYGAMGFQGTLANNHTVRYNDFYSNNPGMNLANASDGPADVPNNFWGAADGPNGGGASGSGDTLTNGTLLRVINALPFAASPYQTGITTPSNHDFGAILASATSDVVVNVAPTTASMILYESPQAYTISGPDADKFQVIATPTYYSGARYLLADGGHSVNFTVRYNPNGAGGSHSATITFNSTYFNGPSVEVSGESIVDVADIATLRSDVTPASGTVRLVGPVVVTVATEGLSGGSNQLVIQDASGVDGQSAILIDDPDFSLGVNYAIGDQLQNIQGVIGTFGAMLQFDPSAAATLAGTTAPPAPLVLTGAENFEDIEAELVRINDADVTETGNWAADTNYNLGAAVGSISAIRIEDSSAAVGQSIPPSGFDVIGIAFQFFGDYQIQPRIPADIIAPSTGIDGWRIHE